MSNPVYDIVKKITQKLGELLGVRVYITITDSDGNFIASDSIFEEYKNFIQDFIKNNFKYLKTGDHSIPLSSQNIIFFKTTDNSITVLYNPMGKIGQLLTFKSIMNNYIEPLENSVATGINDTQEQVEETPIILEVPPKEIEIPIISRKERTFTKIKPILKRKLKEKEKFSLEEAQVLRMCDGTHNLTELKKSVDITDTQILDWMFNFYTKKIIDFEDCEYISMQCTDCKNSVYLFIPKIILDKFGDKIRVQFFPEECDHTCLAVIDKKLKIKTKEIEQLQERTDKLDLNNLSIRNLISFFGQDLFFNIFHAIFFKFSIAFIAEKEIVKHITEFLKKIFGDLHYQENIFSIDLEELEKNNSKYKDFLIIDFDSNIAIDPYEDRETFNFEFNLFKKILSNKDENLQILDTYSEFEKLILHTDTILKEIEKVEEISEDDLIKLMKVAHDITIDRAEIPIIKKLSEIYYNTDISSKLKSTITSKVSGLFDVI